MKKTVNFQNQEYRTLFDKMINLLDQVKQQQLPLVFLDEAIFSFNTFNTKAWSLPYESLAVKDSAIKVKT